MNDLDNINKDMESDNNESSNIKGDILGVTSSVSGVIKPVIKTGLATAAAVSANTTKDVGSLTPNSGELGSLKPFVMFVRNKDYNPYLLKEIKGIESNESVYLGKCSGFTVVKDIHLSGISCTGEELDMIEQAVKEGIYI